MTVGKSRSRSWHRATAWANTRGRNVLTRRTAPFAPENMRSLWPLPFHEGCERRGEESGERRAPALVRFRRVPHELAADLSTASVILSSRTAPNWAVGVDGSGRCWMCVGMPTSRSTRAPAEPEIEGEGLKLVEPRTGMALVLMPRLAREAQPAAEPNRLVLRWTGAERLRREVTDGWPQRSGRRTKSRFRARCQPRWTLRSRMASAAFNASSVE